MNTLWHDCCEWIAEDEWLGDDGRFVTKYFHAANETDPLFEKLGPQCSYECEGALDDKGDFRVTAIGDIVAVAG